MVELFQMLKKMSGENAHMSLDPGVVHEERISSAHHQKTVALAATSEIPGAKSFIDNYFDRSSWKMPYSLPGKRHVNQVMHLGW